MLRRFLAVIFVLVAATIFVIAFIPLCIIWLLLGKDYVSAYIVWALDIFEYMVKQ